MDSSTNEPQAPQTLTDWLRHQTSGTLSRVGIVLHNIGIHPDTVTFLGWILVMVGAGFIANGQMQIGALWLILALPMDALDGAVARAMQRQGRFGAMLDSTLDRYADGFIFAALSYHFALNDLMGLFALAQVALIGSFLVSYTRARAEGLGVDCKVGIFTRVERLAVIMLMLLIPILLPIGVTVLAIGTQVTAGQRIWYVYRSLKNRGD
ncbi:MAG: CDP-alcohol phosphatidyltransferase family protein [Chloroflexota bacterium]